MKKVIAISAGQEISKKGNNIIRQRIKYLNYGLLGLATILKSIMNIDIIVFQADYNTPQELIEKIEKVGININTECECFLLSIPSYYSVSWCKKFCELIKFRYNKKIIVGGRWVVDDDINWIRNKLKYADVIIDGFGEKKLSELFNRNLTPLIPDGKEKCFDILNYELLYDYKKYQPCIEISRGCGAGCQFCADKNNKRLRNKSINLIINELDYIEGLFDEFSIYFEAPHFNFERKWITDLCDQLKSRKKVFSWRCTTRVESVPLDQLGILREAGLKVLDIGLESASKKQLLNMKKTKNPEKYLESAEKLLEECKKNDIWVKFNLLLYAGETYDTICETQKWLNERKDLIKDLSVSSLIYYKNMKNISEILALGATIPEGLSIDDWGYINLDLSSEIDYGLAQKFSVEIPRIVANQKDFYDIKKISYFCNGYTYAQFLEDLKLCKKQELPFTYL